MRRRIAVAGAVMAVGTAAGLFIGDATAATAPTYVTAVATTSAVTKSLNSTGTVQPAAQATADFQVAGTVATVSVTDRQTVTAGQKLATLDRSSLQDAVTAAQSTLNAANAKLAEDELDESTSASASGTSASPSSSDDAAGVAASTTSASTGSEDIVLAASVTAPAKTSADSSVAAKQHAVVADQHTVDVDLQTAHVDLASAQQECSSDTTSTSTTSTSTTSTTIATSTTVDTSATANLSSSASTAGASPVSSGASGTPAACVEALDQAQQAEAQVSTDQTKLASAESALAEALAARSTSSTGTAATATSHTGSSGAAAAAGAGSTSGRGSGLGSSSQSDSASGTNSAKSSSAAIDTDTPQQLASDQATIDTDAASLVVATENLDATILTAPIAGTVVSVGLSSGQIVSAASSSDAITIISPGNFEAQATLSTAQVSEVIPGDTARVTVDGTIGTFSGTVTRVGPVQDDNSTYTYPVVIALTRTATKIPSGADTQIQINVGSADQALVVPTSAVHTTGTNSYVLVDTNGATSEQTVKVGVVGDVYSQVTSGLTAGTVVVLANPSEAVPSSSTNATVTRNRGLQGTTGSGTLGAPTGAGATGGFPPAGGG